MDKQYKELVNKIAKLINDWIDIPVIPEHIEKIIYTKIIYWLVKKIGKKLKKKKSKED